MPEYTILSHREEGLLRLSVSPHHYVLHDFSAGESHRVQLDEQELLALLRALPRRLLCAALIAQVDAQPHEVPDANPFFTLDLDPSVLPHACRLCGQTGCVCEAADIQLHVIREAL